MQLNTANVTQVAFTLIRHTLEAQVFCLHVGPNFVVGKELSMKTCHILSFTIFTFNIVWGKLGGGGALAFWLVGPPIVDLAPTSYTSCSAISSTIQAPTRTLCALHQSTWLSTQPLTPTKRVGCMCVVLRVVPSRDWTCPTCSAWAVAGWSVVSNNNWTRGIKLATSWGWFLSSHFFTDPPPAFLSCNKHNNLGFPCLSQDAVFSEHVHTVIVQQQLSPCKMFKGELAKFCQHDGRVGCFSHPEQGLEEPSIQYFNNFYFLRVHPTSQA